jgi:hypothetical protein
LPARAIDHAAAALVRVYSFYDSAVELVSEFLKVDVERITQLPKGVVGNADSVGLDEKEQKAA